MDGFRVKFVKVYEWFVRCDRLKIVFKSSKKQDYQIVLYFKNN